MCDRKEIIWIMQRWSTFGAMKEKYTGKIVYVFHE
jgi:hypothetical protein